ncbi:hypothetical protein SDC9_129905 [bioreactor metagenome]|uniref:Uncharacterized protein n=1 Tax=bioreactor metagenome TaxID=1076179 RepID=A0A645D180_9ZZZZ
MELRQGPLRLHLRARRRSAQLPAGPRGRPAPPGLLARGDQRRGRRSAVRRHVRRSAARWPDHRRGRVRLVQVRSGRGRHQQCRLPLPPAQRRGDRVPRSCGRRPDARGVGDLRRRGEGLRGAARRVRARGGVADRLPAAAQGLAQAQAAGLDAGPLPQQRCSQGRCHPGADRPRGRGRRARRTDRRCRARDDRDHPGR